MQTVTEAPYQPLLDREPIRYLGVVVGCIIYAFCVNFFFAFIIFANSGNNSIANCDITFVNFF